MPFEKLVLSFIAVNLPLLCVVGAFVGGDVLIIFLSSLAGQGLIDFWTIILFCSIGTVSSDVMWFFLARTRVADRLISSRQLNSGYAKLDRLLSKYGRNDFLLLLLVKFIYGVRIIAIVYFSRERRNFARFLNYNTFAVVVITLFVALLGWTAGRGIRTYVDYYENFKTVMKVIVIFFVAFVILKSLLKKWLLKDNKSG